MRIPSFQALMLPTLAALDEGGDEAISSVLARLAKQVGLTDGDTGEGLPIREQITFANGVGNSLTHLRRAGLVERVHRGIYRMTNEGRQLLCRRPERVDLKLLRTLPSYADWSGVTDARSEVHGTDVASEDADDTIEDDQYLDVWIEAVSSRIAIDDSTQFSINYDAELGMIPAFAEALFEYVICTTCGVPPQPYFGRCPCVEGESWYRVDRAIWKSYLEPLWLKDRRRAYDRNSREWRQEMIRDSDEPTYTAGDVALLREIQSDACYYCGTLIGRNAQVEHLEPLAKGGSNGFNNIVLACPSCNRSKHFLSEAQYWRRLRKRMPQVKFQRVRELAKIIKREKRRRHRSVGAPSA